MLHLNFIKFILYDFSLIKNCTLHCKIVSQYIFYVNFTFPQVLNIPPLYNVILYTIQSVNAPLVLICTTKSIYLESLHSQYEATVKALCYRLSYRYFHEIKTVAIVLLIRFIYYMNATKHSHTW